MWFLNAGSVQEVLIGILSMLVIIFAVLPLHEFAHGWVAYKLGDSTAKYNGRLTLNPVAHIDPLGALALILFRFGWAKPVPVNARNFKNPKAGMAVTALAGPVSNLLAALVGALLYNLIMVIFSGMSIEVWQWISIFFSFYISVNVGLAVFNLIPLPPLDGSKILGAFLPDRILFKFYQYQNVIMIIVFVLLFTDILSWPLNFLSGYLTEGILWLADLPFRLFR